jgi:aryl-alcohol dehydrogenase-like predicted oxidoreductase
LVGEAIKGYPRDKLLLSTKFGLVTDYYKKAIKNTTYKNVMREVQSSLINMNTDYIDFYFIHWPDVDTPIAETMSALNELKKQGAIRYIGVSNFSKEEIEDAQKYGEIDVQQPPYSMVNRKFEELMRWGFNKGIYSMTYGSLGAGILSGAIRTMPNFEPFDLRWHFYDYFREPKFSQIMDFLTSIDKIAEAHNKPAAQVAINWSTQKEFVGSALIGVRNKSDAEENCDAFTWKLSNEEIDLLDFELNKRQLGL